MRMARPSCGSNKYFAFGIKKVIGMAQVYPYQYKGKQTTKQDRCTASIPLDKVRIWLDFNERCTEDDQGNPIYLFSQADIVNDSDGNDVELYEGMEVSVFDNDLDDWNQTNAILAEGIIIKNTLKDYPLVKWLIKLTKNKASYKSGSKYVYWMSDLKQTQ